MAGILVKWAGKNETWAVAVAAATAYVAGAESGDYRAACVVLLGLVAASLALRGTHEELAMTRRSDRNGREEGPTAAAQPPPPPPPPTTTVAAAPPPPPGGRFSKPDVSGRQQGLPAAASAEPAVGGLFPSVVAFVGDGRWSDGSLRVTGTLTLFVEAGQWKSCLTCRATARKAFASARTLQGLFEAMEAGLSSDSLDWRRDGQRKQ